MFADTDQLSRSRFLLTQAAATFNLNLDLFVDGVVSTFDLPLTLEWDRFSASVTAT